MKFPKPLAIALLALAAWIPALAGDVATLRNGFTIRHERREQIGNVTRLYTADGYLDIPTEQIVSVEQEEPPVPAQPEVTAEAAQPAATPAAPAKLNIDQLVRDASSKRQIDPDFVNSVIKYESNFQTRAVSKKGAQGLMQLMPQTAAKLGVKNAFDPRENVEAGTEYLLQLLGLYQNDPIKALAAYNAGAHRVDQYHGIPPYRETQLYVAHIVNDFNRKKLAQMKAKQPATGIQAQSARQTQASRQQKTPAMAQSAAKSPAHSAGRTTAVKLAKKPVQQPHVANLQ